MPKYEILFGKDVVDIIEVEDEDKAYAIAEEGFTLHIPSVSYNDKTITTDIWDDQEGQDNFDWMVENVSVRLKT